MTLYALTKLAAFTGAGLVELGEKNATNAIPFALIARAAT
jgi:hypothetical protein